MKKFIILALFVAAVICSTGVDISDAVSTADLSCLVKQGYTFSIVRCYRSTGSVDPNCASNVANSHSAGMDNVDIYLFPCFKCGNAYDQVSDTLNYTKQNGVKFNTLWLDIEGTTYWGSVADNVAFFTQLINAGEHLGATMGVYTSASQWTPIMGTSTAGSGYPVWYAHYDNEKSFSDFTAFGGWKTPYMKQYNGDQTACGAGVDFNWLPGGNSTTGPSTSATHATAGPATHTTGPATTHTAGPDTSTHAAGPDTSTHAASTHGPDSTGPASSTSKTTSGSGQTTYSGSGDSAGSSSEFKFLDSAIYTAKLGGNKMTIVQEAEVQEVKKEQKSLSVKFSEVEDVLEKDSHFKVVEEKSFNKFV